MPDPRPTRAVDEAYDASMFEDRAPSVGHLLRQRIADTPDNTAYSYPSGIAWDELTWAQLGDRVWQLAAGLVDLGIRPEDRVSLASSTRIEWVLADYAIMAAGAATTTIYPTSISDDVAFIVDNSGSRVVIAEDAEQVGKLRQVREAIPEVMTVVVVDTDGVDLDDWVISFEDLEARGAALLAAEPGVVDARIDATGPQSLATIIYTSGTTGRPKGVRLRHATWTYQGAAIRSTGMLTQDDVHYLWLPLSHVFAKVLLLISTDVGMQTAVDGRIDKIVDNLGEVRPTFMAAAPRIFEKVYGKLSLGMQEEGGAKAKIFDFASATARQYSQAQSDGRRPGLLLGLKHKVADKLVFAKVRDRFGGRVRFFISGSAALNTDIAHWFNGAGLPILEGYGLTETLRGGHGQPALRPARRHRRLAQRPDRDQGRRGRRDPCPRRARHGGVPQQPRGDCRGAHRGRVVPHR
ncbi:AMP-dependent synthetase/ligase [Janibacter hoylei]|uniref:AMP-dependent synthetase/ligase n=1 Tax=Janibacter hoylei TaxID=364298 RepID=UPI00389B27B1